MSKKHFIELANVLRNTIRHDDGETVNFAGIVEDLADFCKSQNPNFNRDRWLGYIAGENGPSGGRVNRAA
jgi:hypothetical protein